MNAIQFSSFVFFFNDTATTEISTLSLHDALPISLALAWGTVVGSVLQIAVQLPVCWRLLRGIPLRLSTRPEGVRDVIVAWLPLLLGAGVVQVSGLIDKIGRASCRERV